MDENGVEALKQLASSLPEASQVILNAAARLSDSFDEKKPVLGPHISEIQNIVDSIHSAQRSAHSSTIKIQQNLLLAAASLAAIISGGNVGPSGKSSDAGSSPLNGKTPYKAVRRNDPLTQASSSSGGNTIESVLKWITKINPHYGNPFFPQSSVNCGSCAFAVEQRLNGDQHITASLENISTDAEMEAATGLVCTYMPVDSIEQLLISRGPGAHVIVGVNRRRPDGRPIAGHWFNALYDGKKVYTIDGQIGMVMDWPHDYVYVSEWCVMV